MNSYSLITYPGYLITSVQLFMFFEVGVEALIGKVRWYDGGRWYGIFMVSELKTIRDNIKYVLVK